MCVYVRACVLCLPAVMEAAEGRLEKASEEVLAWLVTQR